MSGNLACGYVDQFPGIDFFFTFWIMAEEFFGGLTTIANFLPVDVVPIAGLLILLCNRISLDTFPTGKRWSTVILFFLTGFPQYAQKYVFPNAGSVFAKKVLR